MFTNTSTNEEYPKTLVIRNHLGGMIWQIYHVHNIKEATLLSNTATRNGFQAITLEDGIEEYNEETFPDWRESEGGKQLIAKAELLEV